MARSTLQCRWAIRWVSSAHEMNDATIALTACLAREQSSMKNEPRHHKSFLFKSNTFGGDIFKELGGWWLASSEALSQKKEKKNHTTKCTTETSQKAIVSHCLYIYFVYVVYWCAHVPMLFMQVRTDCDLFLYSWRERAKSQVIPLSTNSPSLFERTPLYDMHVQCSRGPLLSKSLNPGQ